MEIFYKGEWGTVCDHLWDLKDAIVVCKELGYTTAIRKAVDAEFGQGTGRTWRENVQCSGTESTLSDCVARDWGVHDCTHGDDAGVVCASKLTISHRNQYVLFSLSLRDRIYTSCGNLRFNHENNDHVYLCTFMH